jgi:hypothetical protein
MMRDETRKGDNHQRRRRDFVGVRSVQKILPEVLITCGGGKISAGRFKPVASCGFGEKPVKVAFHCKGAL